MTWVMLSLMYSFGAQSARIVAVLPPPSPQVVQSTIDQTQAATAGATTRFAYADFLLNVGGTLWRWDTLAFFMLPGEQKSFRISSADGDGGFVWAATGGTFSGTAPRERNYVAPAATGLYQLTISRGRHAKHVNVFVMLPFRHQDEINGYRVGTYSRQSHFPRMGLPRGLIEVTQANVNTWLSPHFRLRDFVCHQPSNFPKYVVLREDLLRKLELLLATVNRKGIVCPTFHVISGYRTPYFNRHNGNVENSVHTYGGAADIYIDADNDGMMDDLNRDGRRGVKDAIALYDLVDLMEKEHPELLGGAGYYRGGAHGAFVHIDVRGQRTRWHD